MCFFTHYAKYLLLYIIFISISGMNTAALSYLSEFHSYKTRKQALTIVSLCTTSAILFIGLLSWIILPIEIKLNIFGFELYSWRLLILSTSSISFIIFISTIYLPESPKYLLLIGYETKALEVLQFVCNVNGKDLNEVSQFFYGF